jgi:hypothetical protein
MTGQMIIEFNQRRYIYVGLVKEFLTGLKSFLQEVSRRALSPQIELSWQSQKLFKGCLADSTC